MKRERGFNYFLLLIGIALLIGAAVIWKHQQRKELTAKRIAEEKAVAAREAQIAAEQAQLDEINRKIEVERQQEIDATKKVYESINQPMPTPDQSRITSKNLPYLTWKAKPIGLTNDELLDFSKAVKGFIVTSLKDPASAVFSGLKVFKAEHVDGSYTFICGRVNAKNSFGGYAGMQNFVVYKNSLGKLEGGIGDAGSIASVRSEEKWWSYDGDDMCFIHGFPIVENP